MPPEDELKRLVAEAVEAGIKSATDGRPCSACCAICTLTPQEHQEHHRTMKSVLSVRRIVLTKVIEYGAIILVGWLLIEKMGIKAPVQP